MNNTYTFFNGISPELRNNLIGTLLHISKFIGENNKLKTKFESALSTLGIDLSHVNQINYVPDYPASFKTDYPFEALLDAATSIDNFPNRLNLYIVTVTAYAVIIRGWNQGEYNAAIKTACRSLWTIIERERYLLEQFPILTGIIEDDIALLHDVLDNIQDEEKSALYKRLNPIKALMNIYESKRADRTWNIATNNIQTTEEIRDDGGTILLQKEVCASGPTHTGISREENNADQPTQELIVDFPQENKDSSTARSSNLKIKKDSQKANHIHRAKVNAPADHNRRPMELFTMLLENGIILLDEIYAKRRKLVFNDIQLAEYERILLILLGLMTSRSKSRIALLKLFHNVDDIRHEGIFIRGDIPYLLFRPQIKSSSITQNRIEHENLNLSLVLKIEETGLFHHKLPANLDKHIIYYFTNIKQQLMSRETELIVNHNDILRKLTSLPYAPITEVQVAEFLNNSLIDSGTDILMRAYLCGHGPDQTASLYYTQLQTDCLYDIYDTFLEQMGVEKVPHKYRHTTVVGSALVPTDKYITSRFDYIKSIIKSHVRDRYISTSHKYHNHYTIYSFRLISLATGHRSVSAPFELITDFDLEHGIVTIADEDVGPSLQPRKIILCKTALKQFKNYIRYLTKWHEHVECYDDELFNTLGKILSGELPLFFLYDEDERMTLLNPSDLIHYRQNIDPLPLNTSRHIIRTHLTQHVNGMIGGTINGEAVDAYMGHASYGQNPNIFVSGFEFNELNKIAKLLEKKFQKLGIEAI